MKLTVQVRLLPSVEQADALLRTLETANSAANAISESAWQERKFGQYDLHKLCYYSIRAAFPLSSQVVVRLFAKVADAYKLDKKRQRQFRPHGSIAYDWHILKLYANRASIWTLDGRQSIPFACSEMQRRLLAYQKGETDLVYRDGSWFLFATIDVEDPDPRDPVDWIGVDLGIVNIAVTSDGTVHSGSQVLSIRKRRFNQRRRLQKKQTRSAKRVLKRLRRKEQRFSTHTNHVISKSLVREAERTERGLVFEQLKGIRTRIRASRSQRRTMHSWAFGQLQDFTSYKARRAGVAVQFVDPRYSSQTCPQCGCIDKANRPTQSEFSCVACAFVGVADHIAAVVLRDRGRAVCNAAERMTA